jgi:hypothetical protein
MLADSLDNVGASTSHNPMGLHGLLQGYLHFTYLLYFFTFTRKVKEYLGDLVVDGMDIEREGVHLDSCCEHGNESSGRSESWSRTCAGRKLAL